MSYKLSNEVFFIIEAGQVLVWNCRSHEQYLLDKKAFFSTA